MMRPAFPDAILVAVDFSPSALRALDLAIVWRREKTEITILHVIDDRLADRVDRIGVASRAETVARMRARAEEEFSWLRDERQESFETMLVEGTPFIEIVRIANDLDCGLIVMGSRGVSQGVAEILFGSTAEKVLRAARQPVLCVP